MTARADAPIDAAGVPPRATAGRAYERVVQWVEDGILTGRLTVGDVLPAERDLAVQLEVSRAAVREGVRALHAFGVVDSRVGAGAAGGTVITAVPTAALNRFLLMHVALAQFSLDDVIDVRCSLEGLSARLAARNATDAQRQNLAYLLGRMDDDALSREEFNALDTEFHVAIARAAGNALATDLTVAIRESMRSPISAGLSGMEGWVELRARLRAEHAAIQHALEEGDGGRAAELLDEHIRAAGRSILGAGRRDDAESVGATGPVTP